MLADLNVCSKKGLVEMFDSSIGAATVTMPYGGKYQMTPVQTMVAKLPVLSGACDTVTMMSYGYDPYLSSWSPYHGAMYAVVSSVAKIVAAGRVGGTLISLKLPDMLSLPPMDGRPKRSCASYAPKSAQSGSELCNERDPKTYFMPEYGNLIAEVAKEDVAKIEEAGVPFDWFGMVGEAPEFKVGDVIVPVSEALSAWENTLEKVFPMHSGAVIKVLKYNRIHYGTRTLKSFLRIILAVCARKDRDKDTRLCNTVFRGVDGLCVKQLCFKCLRLIHRTGMHREDFLQCVLPGG